MGFAFTGFKLIEETFVKMLVGVMQQNSGLAC